MNIKEILSSTADYFNKHQLADPRLDAEVLLAYVLKKDRVQLYVNYDLPLKEQELSSYRELVYRRAHQIPIAYLIGEKEFMSLAFTVNKNVLIPRPETEQLVEKLITYCQENCPNPNIVDVGTGSGAIAVSLAHYLPEARVLASDISKVALQVASQNIKKHQLEDRVKLMEGDLLAPLIRMGKDNVDIVVSNPPYIDRNSMNNLSVEVKQEPELALLGGKDGLDYYREIIPQAKEVLRKNGLLALEIGFDQAAAVKEIFDDNWRDIKVEKDYSEHDRMVFASRC